MKDNALPNLKSILNPDRDGRLRESGSDSVSFAGARFGWPSQPRSEAGFLTSTSQVHHAAKPA